MKTAGLAVTGLLALTLTTAAPAHAGPVGAGTWRAYGTKDPVASNWTCGSWHWSKVGGRICVIRSKTSVQGAIVIDNITDSLVGTSAKVTYYNTGWAYTCKGSGVGPHSYSVCFGPTYQTSTATQWQTMYGTFLDATFDVDLGGITG